MANILYVNGSEQKRLVAQGLVQHLLKGRTLTVVPDEKQAIAAIQNAAARERAFDYVVFGAPLGEGNKGGIALMEFARREIPEVPLAISMDTDAIHGFKAELAKREIPEPSGGIFNCYWLLNRIVQELEKEFPVAGPKRENRPMPLRANEAHA